MKVAHVASLISQLVVVDKWEKLFIFEEDIAGLISCEVGNAPYHTNLPRLHAISGMTKAPVGHQLCYSPICVPFSKAIVCLDKDITPT